MPLAVDDVKNTFIAQTASFAKAVLRNPFTTALAISCLVCIILVVIFRDDEIDDRMLKLFKTFVYTFIATTCVLFVQNTYVLSRAKEGGSSVIDTNILSYDPNAIAFNKSNSDYIAPVVRDFTLQRPAEHVRADIADFIQM